MSETNSNIPQIPESVAQPNVIDTDAVFAGFSWAENEKPEGLIVNESGFLEDSSGSWYLLRRAVASVDVEAAVPDDLYNGKKARKFNSTEGNGLYFANTTEAIKKLPIRIRSSKQPKELYVCKMRPERDEILDVTKSIRAMTAGQQAASILLRARGVMPGIPSPSTKMYDRLYGDASLVATPPMAVARLFSGRATKIADQKLKPKWAIVRDTDALTVVAHANAKQFYSQK